MSNITTNLLFFASALLLFHGDAAAEENSGVDDNIISGRRLSSLRAARNLEFTGPLNLFQQSTATEELPASQQLRGHDDNPPPPTPPLNLFKQNRIVNGEEVDGGNKYYPFQVQLGLGKGWCGGSLIAPDVVLTAGHCVNLKHGDPTHVQVWDESKNGLAEIEVDSRVIHPNYDDNELYNDIALLKLKEPALAVNDVTDGGGTYWELGVVLEDDAWINSPPIIRIQRYQTPSGCIPLYAQGLADDILTLTVIGHGTTRPGGSLAGRLMEADVHYVPNSVCNEQYWGDGISDDMLCAADTDEFQDACQGDSGGPLFTRLPAGENYLYTLVGTTSWGVGCADPEYPGVYSRVAKNTEWIDAKVCGDLSPKSCNADGKIRDYAVESLTGNSRRRAQSVNVSMSNGRALADLDKGTDYHGPTTFKEELCELLGGDVDEETLPPTSSSPTITNSPSRSPIISPSMAPSVTSSLMPSTFPSGSPSLPPGISPTKNFITKNRNGNQKAKGLMFQMLAEEADVMLERIALKIKDDKDTQVQVYIRLGAYEDFPDEGMDPQGWGAPLFNGVPNAVPSGLREAILDEVFTIPKGEMASIHLVGKKEFMYVEGEQEFNRADGSGDFQISTGVATKKAFEQRLSDADFVGGITYKTYTEATKVTESPSLSPTRVTSTPSMSPTRVTSNPSSSPSSSKLPTLPPNEDTSSPSMSPSNLPSLSSSSSPSLSPTENNGGGGDGEYTTVDVYDAGDNAKGVMFSITAKSKLTITGLGLLGKDEKESDLWIDYQLGSYKEDFDALDKDEWIQVFKDKVMLDPDELVDIELDNDISIPAGETVSLYVLSKKGIMYNKSSYDEFDIYEGNDDLALKVGTTTKKEFQQPEKLADFAGRINYQT